MIETELAKYVPQDYQQDPETEDLLPDGRSLRNGMVVLVANPAYRSDMSDPDSVNPHWVTRVLLRHTKGSDESPPPYTETPFDPSYECLEMDLARSALRTNRWCQVSGFEIHDYQNLEDSISFVGLYHDGTQFSHFMPIGEAWLVKKESINAQGKA